MLLKLKANFDAKGLGYSYLQTREVQRVEISFVGLQLISTGRQ
jgi:hypothetical protein